MQEEVVGLSVGGDISIRYSPNLEESSPWDGVK